MNVWANGVDRLVWIQTGFFLAGKQQLQTCGLLTSRKVVREVHDQNAKRLEGKRGLPTFHSAGSEEGRREAVMSSQQS